MSYTYIASGSAGIYYRGSYRLHRGNAIIIPPYMTHMIIPTGKNRLFSILFILIFMIHRRKEH